MEDESDVHEYAKWIGIDPAKEPHLLWIARKGLVAPLPPGWVKTETSTPGEVYYVNEALGDSTWDHPSDEMYRDMVRTERAKAMQSSPAASSPRYQGEPTTPARGTSNGRFSSQNPPLPPRQACQPFPAAILRAKESC